MHLFSLSWIPCLYCLEMQWRQILYFEPKGYLEAANSNEYVHAALFNLWRSKFSCIIHFRFFFLGKYIWTYASSFYFEHLLVPVQLFSLSPAYQLPGICLLTVEMCRGLVSWLAGWLTLQFCSYGAFLQVLKNYHRQARKKSCFSCCKTAHATLNSKCNLNWDISIYFTYQYR